MFSENISLKDWNISVKGKEEVIKAYQDIFDNVKEIHAHRVKFHECGSTMCCEILINIYDENNTVIEEIQVMDIITFDKLMKIKKIKAYKI